MLLQLQVLPAVSHLRPSLLHLRIAHVAAVFHQFLDGQHCTENTGLLVVIVVFNDCVPESEERRIIILYSMIGYITYTQKLTEASLAQRKN